MKKGFTLVEVLIAITLFAIVVVVANGIFIDVVQLETKSSIQTTVYEDVRIILQQITNEIQAGTIDYEEYYNINVIQKGNLSNATYYGINYGVYGSRFYDPGRTLDPGFPAGTNPEDLGLECSYSGPSGCEVFFTHSSDLNTGQNPYSVAVADQGKANALCDNTVANSCNSISNEVDELYLIDSTGTRKTILARKRMDIVDGTIDYVVGIVRMNGRDFDQNGIIDVFSCADEFSCFGLPQSAILYPFIQDLSDAQFQNLNIRVPQKSDLDRTFVGFIAQSQFVPISPKRAHIVDLTFILNPLEDPYKAYSENGEQSHPSVTVIMTVDLSKEAKDEYPGEFQPITVQTTVSAGVIGKIDSYPPVSDVRDVEHLVSWIDAVLPGGVN